MDDDFRIVPRPAVPIETRVMLYGWDGAPLTRQIGFRTMQTTGTFPEIYKTPKRKPKRRGK